MNEIKKVTMELLLTSEMMRFYSDSIVDDCASSPIICDGMIHEIDARSIEFFKQHPQIPQIIAYTNRRLFDTRIANNPSIRLDAEQILLTDKMLRENSISILRNSKCADISFEFEKQIDEIVAAIPEADIQKTIKAQYFNFAKKAEVA